MEGFLSHHVLVLASTSFAKLKAYFNKIIDFGTEIQFPYWHIYTGWQTVTQNIVVQIGNPDMHLGTCSALEVQYVTSRD